MSLWSPTLFLFYLFYLLYIIYIFLAFSLNIGCIYWLIGLWCFLMLGGILSNHKERGFDMDGLAVFVIVAVVIALMVCITTSVIYVIAIFKLGKYMEKFLEEKE